MKIRLEVDSEIAEDEIIIRCKEVNESIYRIQQCILDEKTLTPEIVFYKEDEEYYFPLKDVLFFETKAEYVYGHTASDAYRIKLRLYELEEVLPNYFVRISKSAIVNVLHIFSVKRNITASSLVQFQNSHKQVYVSRHYYQSMRQKLEERNQYD